MSAVARCAVAVVAVVALSTTASATAPDAAPPTAAVATTTVPATTTVQPATSVFPSIDAFAAAWNQTAAALAALDPSVETFVFDPALVVRGQLPPESPLGDVESFGVPIATNGFVGGLVDPLTGEVTAVTVGGDPDAQVVRGAAGILLLATLDVSLAGPAVEAWSALAADTATARADYVVVGPLGVMLEVIEGADPGDNLVSIVIAPVTTPEDMVATSLLTYVAVFDLALEARSVATTTPGSTAPTAKLPATTAASTGPTTTALPMVSLVPPSPTTVPGISVG